MMNDDEEGILEEVDLEEVSKRRPQRKSRGVSASASASVASDEQKKEGRKGGLKGGKNKVREHTGLKVKRVRNKLEDETIAKFLKLSGAEGIATSDDSSNDSAHMTAAAWLASSASWGAKGRRKRVLTPKEEDEFEAAVAKALGFPPDDLSEAESAAGLGGTSPKDEHNYVLVRNHILARWQCDVMNRVSLSQVLESIRSQHEDVVHRAFEFLNTRGFINFGVAPSFRVIQKKGFPSLGSVLVIGAGLAGLAAARQLLNFGFKVTVLEARMRPGGRVHTKLLKIGVKGKGGRGGTAKQQEKEKEKQVPADLGGSVITGVLGNPMGVLARQLGLTVHKIRDSCPLYHSTGEEVDDGLDKWVEAKFNCMLDLASRYRQEMERIADQISLGNTLEFVRPKASRLLRRRRAQMLMSASESGVSVGGNGWISKIMGLNGTTSDGASSGAGLSGGIPPPAPSGVDGDGGMETEEERQLVEWHLANLEFANAARMEDLSLAFWDQDDPYDLLGDHCFLEGANGQLISALAEGLDIQYGNAVESIEYHVPYPKVASNRPFDVPWEERHGAASKVIVTTTKDRGGGRKFDADYVVCTLPLGVLKAGAVQFKPPLPERKQLAIQRLGFGTLNKVVMLFPYAFWGDEVDTFGRVAETRTDRGELFLFYSYESVGGKGLLMGLVAGEAAERFEERKSDEIIWSALAVLQDIFEPRGVGVPSPIQSICTRWKADPWAQGSYSYVKVAASGEDYDALASTVAACIFFAGEATNRHHPATMHGAFLSGMREAAKVRASALQALAGDEASSGLTKSVSVNPFLFSQVLEDLFVDADVEFGCCAVLYDPRGPEPWRNALLRVTLAADMFPDVEDAKKGSGEERDMNQVLKAKCTNDSKLEQVKEPDGLVEISKGDREENAETNGKVEAIDGHNPSIKVAGRKADLDAIASEWGVQIPKVEPKEKAEGEGAVGPTTPRLGHSGQTEDEQDGRGTSGVTQPQASPVKLPSSFPDIVIYTLVTKRQAMVLRELRGGNAARLLALTERFGVKLVGRRGLGPIGEEIVDVLLKLKSKRGKNSVFTF